MCFMRRTLAYLCPIMITFDAVEFSGRLSEEAIIFFCRLVYGILSDRTYSEVFNLMLVCL